MKTILFSLLFIIFISCKDEASLSSENEIFQYIDYSTNTNDCIFKLRILDDVDKEFYDDKFGYSEVKLTKRIYVKDKCFGIKNKKNFENAEKFSSQNEFPEISIVTNISLPTKNKKYKTVFRAYQYYQYDFNTKSFFTVDIATFELRQGEIKYKNRNDYRCLKIIRQDPDENNGFKMQILSFIKLENSWKLAQREKINTRKDKITPFYCYDTISELEINKDKVYELYRNTFEFEENMICK